MMGREIHTTRLLSVVSRPLPDILKPAYNFGGLSLSQLMKPYVDNWLRTRQSVSDLINAFTVFNLSTNLEGLLTGAGGEAENQRLEIMTNIRSNRGMLVTDKATEELKNISAPLGTLDKLQAQSQEQICSVIAVPLVKYLGVTPSGLNASADGEIRVFYDGIKARQEKVCTDKVRTILQILQLDEWSEVDPEIDFEWVPLWELDEASAATVRKTNADTDAVLVEVGAIDPDEVRQRIAAEPESPYAGLDLSKPAPGPPAAAGMEGEMPPEGGQDIDPATSHAIFTALRDHGVADPTAEALLEALQLGGAGEDVERALLEALRSGDDASVGKALIAALGGTDSVFLDALKANDDQPFQKTLMDAFAQDAEFNEADHPRGQPGNAGQFGPGGGGKGAGKKAGGEGKEQAGQKGAEGAPSAASEPARQSPASSLMPNPKKYSQAEARAVGDRIAAAVGATKEIGAARRAVDALNGAQSIDPVEKDGHIDASGHFTPERAAEHEAILRRMFTPEAIDRATPAPGEKPVMVVLGGRGGSGKSWLTDPEKGGPVDKGKFIVIDADHFKGELPEYQGWNAAQVHEESDILVRRAEDLARELGLNIVHDATLKSAKGINERVERYAADGYEIHGHYMHLPPEEATKRATQRFLRGQQKDGRGRFVPPEIILGNTDNEKNFDALIPLFKDWSVFDNSGAAPKFVAGSREHGGKSKE
jgi:predicted ABC-type ATPase